MAKVKFVKSKSLADSTTASADESSEIGVYFPTDSDTLIMGGKEYGKSVTAVDNHYTPKADTSSQLSVDASGGTATSSGATTQVVTGVNIQRDSKGHVTGVTVDSKGIKDTGDTHYTTGIVAGASGATSNSAQTDPYVAVKDNSTYRSQIRFVGSGATSVKSDANGTITISSTDNNTDTKVTSADNHYTPTRATTISATGGGSAKWDSTQMVTGIDVDAKGHVVGVSSIKMPANPNTDTDTKNTAGATDTSSKIFLIGAESQAANPQTYSQDTAYVGTDGCLYSGGAKVLTSHQSISGKSDTTHTHSVKINGTTKTIAATGGDAVDLGTYLTSHQSLAHSHTLTIGSSSKSVSLNGSQSWSLSEIGAVSNSAITSYGYALNSQTFSYDSTGGNIYVTLKAAAEYRESPVVVDICGNYDNIQGHLILRHDGFFGSYWIAEGTSYNGINIVGVDVKNGTNMTITLKMRKGTAAGSVIVKSNYTFSMSSASTTDIADFAIFDSQRVVLNKKEIYCHNAKYALVTDNVASATKLQTARTINGTSFDGSAAITTTQWGTARNISIQDAAGQNVGAAVSVNGSADATLKLPTTIVGNLTGTATTATKLGTATIGGTTKPIYLNGGTATACSAYAGGTAVTLNGDTKAASTASFYAPTTAGTSGYFLTSNGSGAPSWTDPSTIEQVKGYQQATITATGKTQGLYVECETTYINTIQSFTLSGFWSHTGTATTPEYGKEYKLIVFNYTTSTNTLTINGTFGLSSHAVIYNGVHTGGNAKTVSMDPYTFHKFTINVLPDSKMGTTYIFIDKDLSWQ